VGQKIHPVGFRLGITQEHQSRWYADAGRYPKLLQEDYTIRNFLETNPYKLKSLDSPGIAKIRIERKADQIDPVSWLAAVVRESTSCASICKKR
jgi:small subunit ribosomal protein S3